MENALKSKGDTLFLSANQNTLMMKKIVPVILGLLMLTAAKAQDAAAMKKHYLRTYDNAIKYNDINVAINALHG